MTKFIFIRNIKLILIFVILFQSMSFAQDIIYKKTNDSIVCKIIDIKTSYISYKLFNSNDTVTYKILLDEYEFFTKQKNADELNEVNYKINIQPLKKGAYLTFQEYLNNSPSIIFDFKVVTRSDNRIALWGGKKFKIISKDNNVKQKSINKEFWGLCDGTDCYVNCKNLNGFKTYSFLSREKERAFFYAIPSKKDKKKLKISTLSNTAIAAMVIGGAIGGAICGAIVSVPNTNIRVLYLLSYKTGKFEFCGK